MSEQRDLREQLMTKLSRLEMIDMTSQANVINKCIYEMIKNKEFLCLDTLVKKCNIYYIVQHDKARYGKIVPHRVLRHIGGTSRTAGTNEINNRLSSFGWRLMLNKSTCKAIFSDKNGRIEFDLNSQNQDGIGKKISPGRNQKIAESYLPTKADVESAESQLRKSPGEVVDREAVLDRVEVNCKKDGKTLKDNWREITKRNIETWFIKKEE